MKIGVIFTLLGLVLGLANATHSEFKLFHRLYHPSTGPTTFSERGIVTSTDTKAFSFQRSVSFQNDLLLFAETISTSTNEIDDDLFLYQLALELGDDNLELQWDISSVKICHLPFSTTETIYIHYIDAEDPVPHALDYFLSHIPHDGACPQSRPSDIFISFQSFAENVNTTVISRVAPAPPLPTLISPLPLTPEGEPIEAVPEKTFLQKYWMYILAFVIFSAFAGGPEEGERQKQD